MATEVKYDKSHHAGGTPEARIASRLRNSGGNDADHITKHGTGPLRTFHNIHDAGHKVQPGTAAKPTAGFVNKLDASRSQGSGGNP